jgi:DNA polymerase I-like protein with 3'-5' exonuclease and polymerase domains
LRVITHPLGSIYVPGPDDDLSEAYELYNDWDVTWAADTETTGLNAYKAGFRVRIVQVGTGDKAWILRPEWHMQAIKDLIGSDGRPCEWHNWVFDGLAMEQSLGIDFDEMFTGAQDTDIRSRLIDPRPPMKGGTGHKLKDLGEQYVMTGVKDSRDVVLQECKKVHGRECNKDNMWEKIDIDNEVYLRYAGQDVLLTARLADRLKRKLSEMGLDRFYQFERPLSWRLAQMQRDGILFDDEWASRVEHEYEQIAEKYELELRDVWKITKGKTAKSYANSAASLIEKFEEFNVEWTKFSEKTGRPSLDKSVIKELMNLGSNEDIKGLATAVFEAKRNHHYAGYIRQMRDELGADGRIHPNVRPMQAATHRMSISNPPIQQFPRDDPRVRGCLIADDGYVIITADYAQVEFRVAAAVSQDKILIHKIVNGEDLHETTATALFGVGFNKGQRQAAKPIGFGRLYLGGANGIYKAMAESDTTGYLPSIAMVRRAISAFDRDYRGYVTWAKREKDRVEENGGVLYTATGRRLIVSPSYAAPNYAIQSVARDLFAAGVNKAHAKGLGQYIRLVVHDEIVAAVPEDQAQELGELLAECMSTTFKGVPIEVEWEIKGKRWAK